MNYNQFDNDRGMNYPPPGPPMQNQGPYGGPPPGGFNQPPFGGPPHMQQRFDPLPPAQYYDPGPIRGDFHHMDQHDLGHHHHPLPPPPQHYEVHYDVHEKHRHHDDVHFDDVHYEGGFRKSRYGCGSCCCFCCGVACIECFDCLFDGIFGCLMDICCLQCCKHCCKDLCDFHH